MTVIGYLHELRCDNDPCSCVPVPVRSESRVRAGASLAVRNGYTSMTANEAGHSKIASGPARVLIPPRPGRFASTRE